MSTPQPDPFGGAFARPVNQFGTPTASAAPDPFGVAVPAGGWSTPVAPPARRSSGRAPFVAGIAAVLVLVTAGLLVKWWFFPDLAKSISMPATVGTLSQGTDATYGVTVQAKDEKGRAQAVAVYVDSQTRPTQFVMVMAMRMVPDSKNLDLPASVTTSRTGKYTCTRELTAAELLQAAPQAQQSLARARLSSGAVCWRSGRAYTAMGVAFVSAGSAGPVALQAATAGWDAR